jgi:hypothetical protein
MDSVYRESYLKELKLAFQNVNKRLLQEVMGSLDQIVVAPAAPPFSEWSLLESWIRKCNISKLLHLLVISLGSFIFPCTVSSVCSISSLFFEDVVESVGTQYSNVYGHEKENSTWIYVNGLCCTKEIQRANGLHLAELFHREILMISYFSKGLLADVIEFSVRRANGIIGSREKHLAALIKQHLEGPNDRGVVLIAHSAGALFASNAIRWLDQEDQKNNFSITSSQNNRKRNNYNKHGASERNLLRRIEIYTFGCAASQLYQIQDTKLGEIPFYEHFANQRDYVARIGVLAAKQRTGKSQSFGRDGYCEHLFPGCIYTCDTEGHLLGEHYLPLLQRRMYKSKENLSPRLYSYLHKDSPM